jgi:hypothetical protein
MLRRHATEHKLEIAGNFASPCIFFMELDGFSVTERLARDVSSYGNQSEHSISKSFSAVQFPSNKLNRGRGHPPKQDSFEIVVLAPGMRPFRKFQARLGNVEIRDCILAESRNPWARTRTPSADCSYVPGARLSFVDRLQALLQLKGWPICGLRKAAGSDGPHKCRPARAADTPAAPPGRRYCSPRQRAPA